MIIECPKCESNVNANPICDLEFDDTYFEQYKVTLLQCPVCNSPLLAIQDLDYNLTSESVSWGQPSRAWPTPPKTESFQIPDLVRESLVEARKCFHAKAFSACAVMCGRALEATCKHFNTKSPNLSRGLAELKEKGVIDARLFQWATELKTLRNIGAHVSTQQISKQDASDLLDFLNAICEYVFVLSSKFEQFTKRRNAPPDQKPPIQPIKGEDTPF